MAQKRPRTGRPVYFREWRKHRHLTQAQLADRLEVEQGTISKLESGNIAYTQETLEGLAGALGCEPADLLRSPVVVENELAAYVMKLDKAMASRALLILRTALGDDDEDRDQGKPKKSAA
jgi:transcriptional regulator with XRE-family HTH domain